jgi:hypothetical protein
MTFFFFVLIQQYFYDRDFFNNALNGAWQVSVDNIVTKEKENRRLWSRLGVSNFNYRLTILLEGEREREEKKMMTAFPLKLSEERQIRNFNRKFIWFEIKLIIDHFKFKYWQRLLIFLNTEYKKRRVGWHK